MPSGDCPLYETLALVVADDRELLELASHRQEGQPIANMLFGAVHYLLAKSQLCRLLTGWGNVRRTAGMRAQS